MKPWVPALVAVAAAGCTSIGRPENRVTYLCDNGPTITVVFSGNTARIIDTGGGRDIVLKRRATGVGVFYEAPTRTIRRQGDQITYTIGRMAPFTCRPARREPR